MSVQKCQCIPCYLQTDLDADYLTQKDNIMGDEENNVQPESKKRFGDSVQFAFYRSKKKR